MDVATIVTSAGVGALVAAGVTFFNGALERRARRKEVLLAKAIELSHERIKTLIPLAREMKMSAEVPDGAFLAVVYFRYLEHLLAKGELPPDVKPDWEAWMKREQAK
ncbi:MAG: hypothetical protein KIT14_12590 [bacterium]|nr:hypothetical protein [bacterium]